MLRLPLVSCQSILRPAPVRPIAQPVHDKHVPPIQRQPPRGGPMAQAHGVQQNLVTGLRGPPGSLRGGAKIVDVSNTLGHQNRMALRGQPAPVK